MDEPALDGAQLDGLEQIIDQYLTRAVDENPAVAAFERGEADQRFWYVRLDGEEKQHFSIEAVLGQRTLAYESYFMPAPDENRAEVFEYLLRQNQRMHGLAFVIGRENAVYLSGQLGNRFLDDDSLDRVIGSLYMYTEQCFRPAMRLGFASRFNG